MDNSPAKATPARRLFSNCYRLVCSMAFLKRINKRFERRSANQFFPLDMIPMVGRNSNSQIQEE